MIFPHVCVSAKKCKSYMPTNAPVGSIGAANQSGWITVELFLVYLHHFQKHKKCSLEDLFLILLDNHVSHISLEAVDRVKLYGIIMLTTHPHTTHKLKPLEKTVFDPVKKYFEPFLNNQVKCSPGSTFTLYQIGGIAKEACDIAFSRKNIVKNKESQRNAETFTAVLPKLVQRIQ